MATLAPTLFRCHNRPVLVLAPMQDVTDLAFWRVIHQYGGPDLYFTEYLRVHRDSRPEKWILDSIRNNDTGMPVIAQMIGEDIPSLIRTAQALQRENIAAIDLNLGCPAPIVCRKRAGGGLLKDPDHIHRILEALRNAIQIPFTVKTRIGYDSPDEFERLLDVFSQHAIDALTVHGRTVREMYKPIMHPERIRQAAERLQCPVIANGNVFSVESARQLSNTTRSAGLMIGRGAIRFPWLFKQIIDDAEGNSVQPIFRHDLLDYIKRLYDGIRVDSMHENKHVARMKKYLNYIAPGLTENDSLLNEIRRVETPSEFWAVCHRHLESAEAVNPETFHSTNRPQPFCDTIQAA